MRYSNNSKEKSGVLFVLVVVINNVVITGLSVTLKRTSCMQIRIILALTQLVQLSGTFGQENTLEGGWYYHGYGVMCRLYISAQMLHPTGQVG